MKTEIETLLASIRLLRKFGDLLGVHVHVSLYCEGETPESFIQIPARISESELGTRIVREVMTYDSGHGPVSLFQMNPPDAETRRGYCVQAPMGSLGGGL